MSPGHPVWRTPGIDHAALSDALREQGLLHMKSRGWSQDPAKGFGAHGQRMLVLPVLFADSPSSPPVSAADLQRRFFASATESSVRGYYEFVSGGRFSPSGAVLPWLRLPGDKSDYVNIVGGSPSGCGNCGPERMVADALWQAWEVLELAAFDDDGPDGIAGSGDDDGRIDLLVVLHPDAGFENDPQDQALAILAHQGTIDFDADLAGVAQAVGGAYVVASARGPLGVWVHEIGHLLGLEDLYDLEITGTLAEAANRGGLGSWSLMAHGTWAGNGEAPSGLDAVSRDRLGWEDRRTVVDALRTEFLEPVRPGEAASIEVRPFGAWGNEVFVLENRARRDGVVDGDLPGSGILVYRVDDRVRLNRRSQGYWIELLEADGRRDLFEARNNGEASDAFTAGVVGPSTNPSSQSRTPSADRVAPVLEIEAPNAEGRHRIDVLLSETAALRLSRSLHVGTNQSARAYVRLGETSDWDLRFESLGLPPGEASLDTAFVDARLEIVGDLPVSLVASAGQWRPDPPLRLRSAGSELDIEAAPIVLTVSVDGGAPREIALGIPIGLGPGISGADFGAWTPQVLQSGAETTEFTLMEVTDLPLPADAGWVTTTDGGLRYANDVELTLTSPWFAMPTLGRLEFWARFSTESSQPGEAYDGAVLEILLPERGWWPLRPTGSPTALILNNSGANTRGRIGLAGSVPQWMAYEAAVPPVVTPVRVRLRFASDATVTDEGVAVATLGTEPSPGRAVVTVDRDAFGAPVARATFEGNFERVTTVRFRSRRPLDTTWRPASSLLLLRPDLTDVESTLELSEDEPVLTIGVFAEAAGGSAPPILLGQAGYRASSPAPSRLVVEPNPARSFVELAVELRDAPQRVEVYDVRGRRVRTLQVPAGWKRMRWDGTDDHGRRVAAGRYVAVLASDPSVRRSVIFIP